MNCPKCNAWNDENVTHCVTCGTPLQKQLDQMQDAFCKDGTIRFGVLLKNIMIRHSVGETERYLQWERHLMIPEALKK